VVQQHISGSGAQQIAPSKSSTGTRLKAICYQLTDIYTWPCSPEVLFETCVAMKFVDDDGDKHYRGTSN